MTTFNTSNRVQILKRKFTIYNQKAYPQPRTQAPGCGFPIAKIGVLFSLVTGAAIALVPFN